MIWPGRSLSLIRNRVPGPSRRARNPSGVLSTTAQLSGCAGGCDLGHEDGDAENTFHRSIDSQTERLLLSPRLPLISSVTSSRTGVSSTYRWIARNSAGISSLRKQRETQGKRWRLPLFGPSFCPFVNHRQSFSASRLTLRVHKLELVWRLPVHAPSRSGEEPARNFELFSKWERHTTRVFRADAS
jgi:hypothetical protein